MKEHSSFLVSDQIDFYCINNKSVHITPPIQTFLLIKGWVNYYTCSLSLAQISKASFLFPQTQQKPFETQPRVRTILGQPVYSAFFSNRECLSAGVFSVSSWVSLDRLREGSAGGKHYHLIKAFKQIKTLWTGSSFPVLDLSEQKGDHLSGQLSTLKSACGLRFQQNLLHTASL